MKTILFSVALTLLSALGFCQDKQGITITVTINQINNDKGHILLGLHTTDTFMKAKAIQSVKSEIKDGKVTAIFTDVKPGTFAIMVLHDENDNESMDFQPSGMPSETYGMSNNIQSYGPPQFSDAQFEVADKDLTFAINLQ